MKKRKSADKKPGGTRRFDVASLSEIRNLLGETPRSRDRLLEFLHLISDSHHCLPLNLLAALAEEMRLSLSEVYEVATFYHHFRVVEKVEDCLPLCVRVCDSVTCSLFGGQKLFQALAEDLKGKVDVQCVPCMGRCETPPVAVVGDYPVCHANPERVHEAVKQGLHHDQVTGHTRLESYLKAGGYDLFKKVASGDLSESLVLDELEKSGLRGLGGAGFPTARKWKIVREEPQPRYFTVNADEGEPGTFKDRFYLESDPHRFLEGMLVAAKVVRVDAIYIYLRDEYAGIRRMLELELAQLGQLFQGVLPAIELRRGAGSYVCGEESAMIESIEGKRGMPRHRPPYVAQAGLFNMPTLVQNVETLYWIRDILEKGGSWFASCGKNGRNGFRSFSVSGRVKNPGVHRAPAGLTARELVDEYCGGMLPGHEFYAFFPGGASGGILPASMMDVPLDFGTLEEHGCFIGSAAFIVLSDQDSAREAALNAMRFFRHESCGKCTPCRVGTAKAVTMMEEKQWQRSLLDELAKTMQDASICGLGQAAPNPMQCVMRYFPHEI